MALHIVTRRWWFSMIITCVMLSTFYVMYAIRSIPRGGSLTGYVLGFIATGLIVTLMLLPIRKRQYQRPVGSLDVWMRLHVILGVITAFIVAMHAGFKVVGTINIALTVVFVLTLLSGMLGTFLYEWYPIKFKYLIQAGVISRQPPKDIMPHPSPKTIYAGAAQSGNAFRKKTPSV